MKTNWKKLLNEGKIQRKGVSFKEVDRVFSRAQRVLKSAELLLEKDEESAYQLSYEAMMLAGRALIFSFGLKPRTVGAHAITVEFCQSILGEKYKLLVEKFNRARKKRNYLIYGTGIIISPTEAKNLIKTAKEFLKVIKEKILATKKQKKLI